jgi:hypothetical protein
MVKIKIKDKPKRFTLNFKETEFKFKSQLTSLSLDERVFPITFTETVNHDNYDTTRWETFKC